MKVAISGSFDPITNGHIWLIKEALNLFSHVTVIVADNPSKNYLFTPTERVSFIEENFKDFNNISVVYSQNQFVAQVAHSLGINYIVRGVRNTQDFEQENILQQVNKEYFNNINTLFFMPPKNLTSVSSTFVKSFIGPPMWHEKISNLVPHNVSKALSHKWLISQIKNHSPSLLHKEEYIFEMYEQPNRSYHNINHLVHCISEYLTLPKEEQTKALLGALIYHDIIYNPQEDNNEEKSCEQFLDDFVIEFSTHETEHIKKIILATKHHQPSNNTDINNIISIDLAILGQDKQCYDTYKKAIKKEYSHLTKEAFINGRIKVINYFLEKAKNNTLFPNPIFSMRYNNQAIENLSNELRELVD